MHIPRANCACLLFEDSIYVVGGDMCKDKCTSTCEIFDIKTKQWSIFGEVSEAKAYSSLCVLSNSFLYWFGGFNKNHLTNKFTDTIERIQISDIHTKKWEIVNVKLHNKMCVLSWIPLIKDSVLIFGGSSGKQFKDFWLLKVNKIEENKHRLITLPEKSLKYSDEFIFWNSPILLESNKIAVIGQSWVHQINLRDLSSKSIKIHL